MTAPESTSISLEAGAIQSVEYHLFRNTTHIVCCATLKNGYTVIGESACADAALFDLSLGQQFALEDTHRNIGRLLAYVQAEKLMYGETYEH